jgi:hypothetical protein
LLAEKYFPKGSTRYDSISQLFKKLDWLNTLKLERWFGVWTMILAGSNVSIFLFNRWSYWDWKTFNFVLLGIFLLVIIFISVKPNFLHKIDSFEASLKIFFKGILLFLLGTIPFGLDLNTFVFGIPYYFFFIVAHLTWSIVIDNKDKSMPPKKEIIKTLLSIITLTLTSALLGYINDDPMISTIAIVYLLFPIVILLFPVAIRHLQRARMHVIFIPAMFISVRFPWFLLLILPLFWIIRYYNYFRFGEVKPSFKVDLPTNMKI